MISPDSRRLQRAFHPSEARSALQRVERRRAALSEHDRQVIERIEQLIHEGRAEEVGAGRSADVFILDIWGEEGSTESQGLRPWVLKSERERIREQRALNLGLADELVLHERAYELIAQEEAQEPGHHCSMIPRPLALLADEERQWLIMEYVPGETLFERALRSWLLYYRDPDFVDPKDREAGPLSSWKRDKLVSALMHSEFINALPRGYLERIQFEHDELDESMFFGIALAARENLWKQGVDYAVMTPEQVLEVSRTVEAWHRGGFFHRDLHPSNFILTPEGRTGIIDFGLALYDPDRLRRNYDPDDLIYAPNPFWAFAGGGGGLMNVGDARASHGREQTGGKTIDRIQLISDDVVLEHLQRLVTPKKRL